MTGRLLLLAALLAVAAGVGIVSTSRVRDQLAALDACQAAERGDWPAALAASEGPQDTDETGRAATECRCLALLATGDGEACVALLERQLAASASWAPRPELSVHLIQTWREQGDSRRAAELARRAGQLHPHDPDLFYAELVTRSSVEPEGRVLRELAARLPTRGPAAARMRVSLANRHLLRGDAARALVALGPAPPPEAGEAAPRWFETRGRALAAAGDLAGVQQSYESWRQAGGAPAELFARYALTLSLNGLREPERDPVELLSQGFQASRKVEDPLLQEALAIRLVISLVAAGRKQEALAFYDRARQQFPLEGITRQELERSVAHERLADAPAELRRGTLAFRVPGSTRGDAVWLSPERDAPPDAPYEPFVVPASGVVRAERSVGVHPVRWVYRDAAARVRASGTVTPAPDRTIETDVVLRSVGPVTPARLDRGPADGRRRVVVLLPDCQDWRLVQYLRARGELPVMDALLESGYRAVLESDPPLTAAAMEALVWPSRRSGASFVGLLHQMGVELAGLSSLGDNPLGALRWVLPEEASLFDVVGAGEHTAANLLFTHGGIQAGRHGELTGPRGRRRRTPVATSARDLTPAERDDWPALAGLPERDAIHVRTIAAELDAAEELARDRHIDLVMLRIEPLDILTHAHFAQAVADGQDDGEGLLFSVYRYIDARIESVYEKLDDDDVLIVMSDHGIRTSMEHSRDAIFVAVGGEVPAGRAGGSPSLRGVPRVVADLLGVETDWPDAGVAVWTRNLAAR